MKFFFVRARFPIIAFTPRTPLSLPSVQNPLSLWHYFGDSAKYSSIGLIDTMSLIHSSANRCHQVCPPYRTLPGPLPLVLTFRRQPLCSSELFTVVQYVLLYYVVEIMARGLFVSMFSLSCRKDPQRSTYACEESFQVGLFLGTLRPAPPLTAPDYTQVPWYNIRNPQCCLICFFNACSTTCVY